MWYEDDDVICSNCGEVLDMRDIMECDDGDYLCSLCRENRYGELIDDFGILGGYDEEDE